MIKKVFRSCVVIFLFCFFGLGALILNYFIFPCIAMFVEKEKQKKTYCLVVHKTWRFFCDLMENCKIIKINFDKSDELKNTKSQIIVSNHPSFIDIVILIGYLPNTICVAKKELRQNLFMGNIVKSLFLINDENKDILIQSTTKLLDEGYNIIVFPTGTRTEKNKELKLHKGAALMAIHTKTDITTLHIDCDSVFLAKNQTFCDAGNKTVNYNISINKKINLDNYTQENLTDIQLRNRINTAIKENISN